MFWSLTSKDDMSNKVDELRQLGINLASYLDLQVHSDIKTT